jgi:D-alanyl-D-alanine dipeptidase
VRDEVPSRSLYAIRISFCRRPGSSFEALIPSARRVLEGVMPDELILLTDPLLLRIAIEDVGELLVDLREHGLLVDDRKRRDNSVLADVREGVAERLLEAQARLPNSVRLLVVEGLRPAALQARYFVRYCRDLSAGHPEWSQAQVRHEASKYVAPPDVVPPHCTGGAVDVTLVGSDGAELDMGTPVNASPEESTGACFTDAGTISDRARVHRNLLNRAMTAVGFVNYPTEWWHWSYGDRYWAMATGHDAAIYGALEA